MPKSSKNVGIVLVKTVGDKVKTGETIAKVYGKKIDINNAFSYSIFKPKKQNIIIKIIK